MPCDIMEYPLSQCRVDIWRGPPVVATDIVSVELMNRWIRGIRQRTGLRIDWHVMSGKNLVRRHPHVPEIDALAALRVSRWELDKFYRISYKKEFGKEPKNTKAPWWEYTSYPYVD